MFRFFVSRAGKGVDLALLIFCDLRDNMRGGAEAVNAQPFAGASFHQTAITNQTCAHERRRFGITVKFGYRKTKMLVGDGVFRVTAVDRIAGEFRQIAEVFLTILAVRTPAAGPTQPRHTDAVTGFEA